MKNISITVPMDYQALTQAAGMFRGLAETMAPPEATAERPDTAPERPDPVETLKEAAEVIGKIASGMGVSKDMLTGCIPTKETVLDPLKDLKSVTHEEEAEVNIPSAPMEVHHIKLEDGVSEQLAEVSKKLDALVPEPDAAEVFALAPTPESVKEGATVNTGVDLDINGIPWDNRIHASTKTKTVNGAWKNKRGVDKELLDKVTWELKNAMAHPETVLKETPTPLPVTITDGATAVTTPAPPAAPGSITTFPALISAITAKGLDPAIVQGAITAVGLQSLPLLAARTDLIPQVAERLGL